MNMDYALCEGIKHSNTDGISGVILAYDVNCQYSINFRRRVATGPFLDFPAGLALLPAIGLFHVHGHQDDKISAILGMPPHLSVELGR